MKNMASELMADEMGSIYLRFEHDTAKLKGQDARYSTFREVRRTCIRNGNPHLKTAANHFLESRLQEKKIIMYVNWTVLHC